MNIFDIRTFFYIISPSIEEKEEYMSLTEGAAQPCQSLGMDDVLDTTECLSAAISLKLINSHYNTPTATQSESDRPYGCRAQTYGDVLVWMNTKENSPSIPSESNIVICRKPKSKFSTTKIVYHNF